MTPTLKNILRFFHPHTYWLSPPSLSRFCFLQECWMLRCGIFLLLRYFKENNVILCSLMSFQYVRNYHIPCWLKPFLFILNIDKQHEFSWLCCKDPCKVVQASERFFQAFYARDCYVSDMDIKNFFINYERLKSNLPLKQNFQPSHLIH